MSAFGGLGGLLSGGNGLNSLFMLLNAFGQNQQQQQAFGANSRRYDEGQGLIDRSLNAYEQGIRGTPERRISNNEFNARLDAWKTGGRQGPRPSRVIEPHHPGLREQTLGNMARDNAAGLKGLRGLNRDVMGSFNQGNQRVNSLLGGYKKEAFRGARDTLGAFNKGQAGLMDTLNQRYARGMNYLKGSGDQERKDINTQFDSLNASNNQGLVDSGLSGSTLRAGMRSGAQRQRADSLGGLDERLRQQYLNTDAGLSGDIANAQSAGNQFGAGLRQYGDQQRLGALGMGMNIAGDQAANRTNLTSQLGGNLFNYGDQARRGITGATEGFGRDLLNRGQQYFSDKLNWTGNRQDMYPDNNAFMQLMSSLGNGIGMREAAANQPSPWSLMGGQMAGSLGGGLAGGLGLGLATKLLAV